MKFTASADARRPLSYRSRIRTACALLVAAARVGGTRLIDNVPVVLPGLPAGGRLSDAAAEGRARDAADD